ncbi:cytochrome b [Rhizobium sp. KVB221]|uniref:Cytochrome b n=1 Tax=Rhizobium setariae TaxID=2801340 RepID=A0A936YN90_9HYPH|nr:cytochrome b [Rhizobium setariae]MBL0371396.1 cytochrome b [Rhizobium setariae]
MLRNTEKSWGLVSFLFHWIMAALFLCQFWIGWYMQGLKDLLAQYNLYQLHKSLGFTILALAVLRVIWALGSWRPAPPASMPEVEKQLSRGSHFLLYLALFVLPLTGWAVVSTSPLPIATWFFGLFVIPSLPLGISLHSEQVWTSIHGFLAYGAIFLVAVHILAALRHHFHHRDDILMKMVRPGFAGRKDSRIDKN